MSLVDWFMASFLYFFHKVVAFPTIATAIVVALLRLKALAKSKGNLFAIAFKSDNFRERAIRKEAKN